MANPTSIGKYEILATVGRGGMGVVYRAQDPRMGRQVAIKTVTEGLSNDAGMLQRFYREAEKMGMLKHPNIITVYDLGEQDGFPYIVMEFVEGDPLDRLIQSNRGPATAPINRARPPSISSRPRRVVSVQRRRGLLPRRALHPSST